MHGIEPQVESGTTRNRHIAASDQWQQVLQALRMNTHKAMAVQAMNILTCHHSCAEGRSRRMNAVHAA